ncbi:MAG: hypothetical protein FWE91_07380 [Defluviitaleaceae bacterium]|nr:hypothetical protein [Defluviitaleaceae bacterium]MCL2837062.1 hypothetical protein [Defluviitaleaceae bacterium]
MVTGAVFALLLSFASYVAASCFILRRHEKELEKQRKEMIGLYVQRANLAPALFAAARRHSPIPMDIYNSFIQARDRFAGAGDEPGMRIANEELDVVFADFFAYYVNCREPLYIKAHEDYTKIMEKIHFTGNFYENAFHKYKAVNGGPLRYGALIAKGFRHMVIKITMVWRKGIE